MDALEARLVSSGAGVAVVAADGRRRRCTQTRDAVNGVVWLADSTSGLLYRFTSSRRRFLVGSALAAAAGPPVAALRDQAVERRRAPPRCRRAPSPVPATAVPSSDGDCDRRRVPARSSVSDRGRPPQDSAVRRRSSGRFELFTVSSSNEPGRGSGGPSVKPTHAFDAAPQARRRHPGAHNASPEISGVAPPPPLATPIRDVGLHRRILSSRETGLLDGKTATTHHGSWDDFRRHSTRSPSFAGSRFVETRARRDGGRLTSGIDLGAACCRALPRTRDRRRNGGHTWSTRGRSRPASSCSRDRHAGGSMTRLRGPQFDVRLTCSTSGSGDAAPGSHCPLADRDPVLDGGCGSGCRPRCGRCRPRPAGPRHRRSDGRRDRSGWGR